MDFIIKFLIALILLAILGYFYLTFYRKYLEEKSKEEWNELKEKLKATLRINVDSIEELENKIVENEKLRESVKKLQRDLGYSKVLNKVIKFINIKEKEETIKNDSLKNEKQEIDDCNQKHEVSKNRFKDNDFISIVKDNLYFGRYSKIAIIVIMFIYIFLNIYYLHIMGIPIQTFSYNYLHNNQYFNMFEFPFIVATILIIFLKQLAEFFKLFICYLESAFKNLKREINKPVKNSYIKYFYNMLKSFIKFVKKLFVFFLKAVKNIFITLFVIAYKNRLVLTISSKYRNKILIDIKKFSLPNKKHLNISDYDGYFNKFKNESNKFLKDKRILNNYNFTYLLRLIFFTFSGFVISYIFYLNFNYSNIFTSILSICTSLILVSLNIDAQLDISELSISKKIYIVKESNLRYKKILQGLLFIIILASVIITSINVFLNEFIFEYSIAFNIVTILFIVFLFSKLLVLIGVYAYSFIYPLKNIAYLMSIFYMLLMFIYTILTDFKKVKIYDVPIYFYDYTLANKYAEVSNFLKPVTIKHDEESKKVLFAGETDRFIYYYDIDDFKHLTKSKNYDYNETDICKSVDKDSTAIFKNALMNFHKDVNLTKLSNFRNSCRIIQKEGTKILGFCMDNQKESFDINSTKDSKIVLDNFSSDLKGNFDRYKFDEVNFDFNSSFVKDEFLPSIKKFVKYLEEKPTYKAEIRGHTDDLGDDNYNTRLSRDRAKAVYDKLIELGISKDRLRYKGCGERCPTTTNDTEEKRAENRRVEAIIKF